MEKNPIVYSFWTRRSIKFIFLTMKLLSVLILAGSMAVSASTYSQKTKIDLQFENSSLTEILSSIEKNSEFIFIFNSNVVSSDEKRSISVSGEKIEVILNQLFNGDNVAYRIDDRQVFLYKKEKVKDTEPITGTTQLKQPEKKDISGKVIDGKGEPIPGATIMIKSTTIGVVTDSDGNFAFQVPVGSKVLSVSFVGYKTQEIEIGNKATFKVIMEEVTVGVDEVVVVGYGVQKKESIVGSIVQTTNEELKRSGNVTDLKQALTGQLPGITTITSSGEPGGTGTGESATSIFIRGRNTWNGGQPLILVDGVERSMDNIDVSEVESISVLKDASATAVFGVKGANGVILITTKRGSISKPKLSFSYNATALTISKLPQKLDSYNALLLKNEIIERETVLNETSWADYTPLQIINHFRLPQTPTDAFIYPNVNWTDALFSDFSLSHRAALNVQGGTNFVSYFGSVTYLHEGDMFKQYENNKGYKPNYNFDRLNFRSNLDFKLTKTTKLQVNLSGYFSQKNTSNSYHNTNSSSNPIAWASAYQFPPDVYLPQYPDGRWGASYKLPAEQLQNPVALIYNTGIIENRETELNADFALEQKLDFITEGLSTKLSVFYDNNIQTQGNLYDAGNAVRPESGSNVPQKIVDWALYTGPDQDPSEYIFDVPSAGSNQFDWIIRPWNVVQESLGSGIMRRMMYQFQINYARGFGHHNIGAMALVKREEYASGSEFKHFREDWVSRVTYDYDTRYLFELNGAYNGSEKFGPGYRFDFFPSLALGWYISNEKFFKIDWINKLKIRYSTGLVGDDQGGGRWLYDSQYSYGGAARMNQDASQTSTYTWYKESVVGNPDIHWEKARKDNYGLEIGLLDNMFAINYDYFTEDRTDILLSGGSRSSIPPYFGATAPSANVGAVKSNGHEIEMKFEKRTNFNLHYWANLSFTHTENTITKRDDPALLDSYLKQEGYSIGQSRTLVRAGFYNNWDEIFASVPTETNDLAKLPGYYNLLDFNGDGYIKSTEDQVPYGYSEVPQNTYNCTLGADYKGFSLMVQFYGVNDVSRYVPLSDFVSYQDVIFNHALDYWSKDNPDASSYLPRWKTQGQNIGDYFLFDGSFVRFKTAEIAYNLQDKLIKKLGLSSLRIYLNGNNLYLWSKLPDDREAAWTGGSANQGAYPTPKRFNLGIDLTF